MAWCSHKRKQFVYASLAAVYGDGTMGFDDVDDDGYLAQLRPMNPYGWSKLLFDHWVIFQLSSGRTDPTWIGLFSLSSMVPMRRTRARSDPSRPNVLSGLLLATPPVCLPPNGVTVSMASRSGISCGSATVSMLSSHSLRRPGPAGSTILERALRGPSMISQAACFGHLNFPLLRSDSTSTAGELSIHYACEYGEAEALGLRSAGHDVGR
jgi:hypothetical protein